MERQSKNERDTSLGTWGYRLVEALFVARYTRHLLTVVRRPLLIRWTNFFNCSDNVEGHLPRKIGISEEFSIVPSRKWKSRGTIGALGHKVFNRLPLSLSLSLFLLSRPPPVPLYLSPFFRTIVQLILILFRFGETSVICKRFPPWKMQYSFNRSETRSFREIILLESCCIISRLRHEGYSLDFVKRKYKI